MYETWLIRNLAQHGLDKTEQERKQIELAQRQTAELYKTKNKVLPRDHDLFYNTLEEHYEQEPSSRGLFQWINTWQPVIIQSVKDAATLGIQSTKAITNFFTSLNITASDSDDPD